MGFFDKIASLWGQNKESEEAPKQPVQQHSVNKQANRQQSPAVSSQTAQSKGTTAQSTKPLSSQTASPVSPAAKTATPTQAKPAQSQPATPLTQKPVTSQPIASQTAKPAVQPPPGASATKPAETLKTNNGVSAPGESKKPEVPKPVAQSGPLSSPSAQAKPPTAFTPEVKPVATPPSANTVNIVPAKTQATDLSSLGLLEDDDLDFDSALDAAFDSLTQPDSATPAEKASAGTAMTKEDKAAVEELFVKIAANYARPVKNFIFELKRGTATKEWIDICKPAMNSISKAADGMGLDFAAQKMSDFEEALALAQSGEGRALQGESRDLLLSCYEELVREMPVAFTVSESEQQREGIIINSLLKQVPDLGRVTVEKLYKAGLTSLDMLFIAKKEEMAVASGIPLWLAERISNKFQEYRQSLEGPARNVDQSGFRSRLVEMIKDLKKLHEGFEYASANEWSDASLTLQKRKFRQERQDRALQINVLLAEMGETELVNELQKLSFERRIEKLEEFIASLAG
jgi:hypothetical protein